MTITRRTFASCLGVAGLAGVGTAMSGVLVSCSSGASGSGSSQSADGSASGDANVSAGGSVQAGDASMSASASGTSSKAGGGAEGSASAGTDGAQAPEQAEPGTGESAADGNALVVYFSHAGENYGVGYITQGNTALMADQLAEMVHADVFEIVPASAYPEGYDDCCDVALEEQHQGMRPEYLGDIDPSRYNTIYLGYPIWWGDMPMAVYTFIEAHDWQGKEIYPFCTHAGSRLSNTVSSLEQACTGAAVHEGLAILGTTAQNTPAQVQSALEAWLDL